MIVLREAYQAGLFQPKHWLQNVLAGSIVGVVALPLAMAFAIASGAKPEQGLYTAIVAAICVAVFGGSRVQIAGPTGAFVVILAAITAKYGIDGLQLASLMAGLIMVGMGYARLGSVIKFIPDPVIVGFTTGIGFIIFVGEWKDFFGLPMTLPLDGKLHQKLILLFEALPQTHWVTMGLGCLSLFLIIITPRLIKRVPGPLVALIVMTLLEAYYQFDGVTTLGNAFGGIPQTLPTLHFPALHLTQAMELIGPAFTIALLGAIESLLSATAADSMAGTAHNSNQELVGQGIANILTPLFGGFAATGAIARTATNVRNGGNSPLAAIVHSVFLIGVILLLAPMAAYIPLCVLAAILFVVAYNMSDIPHFIRILRRAPRYDVIVLLATFLLTVFTNLVLAVNVGVILAMFFFVRRMHQIVSVERQSHEALAVELAASGVRLPLDDVMIYRIQGPVFFGVAEKVEHVLAMTHLDPKHIVLRLQDVPFIDMTGIETLIEVIKQYYQRGVKTYLCEANEKIKRKLQANDILPWVENHRVFERLTDVLTHISVSTEPKA